MDMPRWSDYSRIHIKIDEKYKTKKHIYSVDKKLDEILEKLRDLDEKVSKRDSNPLLNSLVTAFLTCILAFVAFLGQRSCNNSDVGRNETVKQDATTFANQKKDYLSKCKLLIVSIDSALETYCLIESDSTNKNKILSNIIELRMSIERQPYSFKHLNVALIRYIDLVSDELENIQNDKRNISTKEIYKTCMLCKDSCIRAIESSIFETEPK
jgi:hypothetical protein